MIPMPSISGIVKRNPRRRPCMHLVMALLTDHITVAQFKTDAASSVLPVVVNPLDDFIIEFVEYMKHSLHL